MFYNIIIPAYNCSKTIDRLMSSIVAQNLTKDELEVIFVNDNSTDNCEEIAKTYCDVLNIKFIKTKERDMHCPGNTRLDGLAAATADWICFIDNDDMFEPDILNAVRTYISLSGEQYLVSTNMREYFYEEKEYGKVFDRENADTWLHGKFYNRVNLIEKYNIQFKENLYSHEDVYFNNLALAALIANGKDYNYCNLNTYKWIYNPESLSRSYFNTEHFYIEEYLKDYMYAAGEVWFTAIKQHPFIYNFCYNQIMMCLLHSYFYYQSFVYKLGDNIIKDNYTCIQKYVNRMIEELGVTKEEIIKYIYDLPQRYMNIKTKTFSGSCAFVEVQSFKDFITNL